MSAIWKRYAADDLTGPRRAGKAREKKLLPKVSVRTGDTVISDRETPGVSSWASKAAPALPWGWAKRPASAHPIQQAG